MGKRRKSLKKTDSITYQEYCENIKYGSLRCYWDPKGKWIDAHGDGKSCSFGKFYLQTTQTSGTEPQFRLRIMNGSRVAYEPVVMDVEEIPSDDDVVDFLKEL